MQTKQQQPVQQPTPRRGFHTSYGAATASLARVVFMHVFCVPCARCPPCQRRSSPPRYAPCGWVVCRVSLRVLPAKPFGLPVAAEVVATPLRRL